MEKKCCSVCDREPGTHRLSNAELRAAIEATNADLKESSQHSERYKANLSHLQALLEAEKARF